MNLFSKITAAMLAAFMVLAAGGCSTADTSWAYELDGERMPAGIYINYILDAYTEAETKYVENNKQEGEAASAEQPKANLVLKSEIEGQAADIWIAQRAQQFAMQHYGVMDKYNALGLALSDEDMSSVASTIASVMQYGAKFYEANGISENSIREYFIESKKKEQLFYALYREGGEFGVSDAELKELFTSQYIKGEYMRVAKETEGDDLEARNATIKTQAQGYLDRIAAGESFEDVDYEYKKSVAAEGQEVTKAEPGANTLILGEKNLQNYGKLGEGLGQSTMDKPILVESDTEFFIIRRLDIAANPSDMDNYRDSLLGELKYQDYLLQLEEWGEAKAPTANQAAISRYTADKLKVDYSKYA